MKVRSREWNAKMIGSHLPSALELLLFKSKLFPKLKYPLLAISLSDTAALRVLKTALPLIKHGLGITKKSSTKIIFFLGVYDGYDILDIHVKNCRTSQVSHPAPLKRRLPFKENQNKYQSKSSQIWRE